MLYRLFFCLYFCKVATKTLPFYKEYFSVPYPLPKIDLIAIADFAAGELIISLDTQFEMLLLYMLRITFDSHSGAMENWGLVTYR